ncbi:MAG: PAS domain S-box protein [Planctomycetaceae bacterium]|nr:PAS domain S-box protein [Planctomycetaceae bacterium]
MWAWTKKLKELSKRHGSSRIDLDALSDGWHGLSQQMLQNREELLNSLTASESRFRATVECSPIAMVIIDEEGKIVLINQETEFMFGYEREELIGEYVELLVPEKFRDKHPELRQSYFQGPKIRRMAAGRELFGLHKDGIEIPIEIGLNPIVTEGGIFVLATIANITDRLESQRKLQAAFHKEQEWARKLQELAEISLSIRGDRPLADILQNVTDRTRSLLRAHQAVTSFTTDRNWTQAITGVSLSEKYAAYRTYDAPPDGTGIYSVVCESNQPIRMTQEELEAHPRWRGFGPEAGKHPPMRGWLAAPLRGQDGRNLGLIELSDKVEGEFTAEDESILVQIAQLTSTAVEIRQFQDHLEEMIVERTSQLETNRERLDLALRSSGVGTWNWDVSHDVVQWDEFMYPLFGIEPGTFNGKYSDFEKYLAPGESQRVAEEIKQAIKDQSEYDTEFQIVWPDRSIHTVAARGKVYRNPDDQEIRMTGVCWDITSRNREQAIRRALIDQSKNFIGLLTPDGKLIDANRTALAAAGVSESEVIGKSFWETPWWAHSPELQARLRQSIEVAAKGTSDGFEATHIGADGKTIVVDFTLKPVKDSSGNVIYLIPEGSDITEHKRRDAELKRLLSELEDVASGLALPVHSDFLKRRQYRLDQFSLSDMIDCGSVVRGLCREFSGSELSLSLVNYLYNSVVDESGAPAFALVRMFETRLFAELTESQQELARTLSPEIKSDTRCLTLMATVGAEEAWNDVEGSQSHRVIPLLSEEAILQMPMVSQLLQQTGIQVSGILNPESKSLISGCDTGVFHVENAVGSSEIPAQDQFVIPYGIQSVVGFGDLLPNGRFYSLILFSKVPVSHDTAKLFVHLSQSVRMALLAHLDIPNRTEAQIVSVDRLLRSHERIVTEQEELLKQTLNRLAASNAELEQFAYVASHDLQEPLRKIRSFGNLLLNGYPDQLGAEGQDYLQRMQKAAERMQTLIDDLLTLSRVLRKGQTFSLVDMNEIVQSVIEDLEDRLSVSGGVVHVSELPTIHADPTQMRQLMQNLIGNALKYRKPDVPPVVSVTVRNIAMNSSLPRNREDQWEFEIADNGIGFAPEYAQRIFQPFQRLHGRSEYEGTGIGLTICKRIVDRHKGQIWAESQPGQGAHFFVRLPANYFIEE